MPICMFSESLSLAGLDPTKWLTGQIMAVTAAFMVITIGKVEQLHTFFAKSKLGSGCEERRGEKEETLCWRKSIYKSTMAVQFSSWTKKTFKICFDLLNTLWCRVDNNFPNSRKSKVQIYIKKKYFYFYVS